MDNFITAVQKSLLSAGLISIAILLFAPRTMASEECRQLVRNKCASCHFVTYICPRIEKGKGSLAWKGIVNDMIAVGMTATGQEQEQLVRCLAQPGAEVRALCAPAHGK